MTKKIRKKLLGCVVWFLLCLLMPVTMVFAEETINVMETYTGETEIFVYVKGADPGDDVTVQIGTSSCNSVTKKVLTEEKLPMNTLVLLDNSASIPKMDRGTIAQLLQNIISDRAENEKIAIAVLGQDIEYLADFTSDYTTLKSAIDKIEYQQSKTYLTDALYNWLGMNHISRGEDSYQRIIIISDGTDNKSIGYTKDELFTLLKEYPIPIYTVGMQAGDNNENLRNLFALSRTSGAESFLLDEISNVLDINIELNKDRNMIQYVLKPDAELLDGSKKMVKFTYASGRSVSAEISMPQQEKQAEVNSEITGSGQEETEVNTMPEIGDQTEQPNEETEQTQNDSDSKSGVLPYVLIAAVVLCILTVVGIMIARRPGKESKSIDKASPVSVVEEPVKKAENVREESSGETELLGSGQEYEDDGKGGTVMFWSSEAEKEIILTDIHFSGRLYRLPIRSALIIGRTQGDVKIDYDKSVSNPHCKISTADSRYYIEDLQSTNGTYIGNDRVNAKAEILSGDIVKLGRVELKFEIADMG